MSKVQRDFYHNPPSVYPIPEPGSMPRFSTTYSVSYGPDHDKDVFRRSMTYGTYRSPFVGNANTALSQTQAQSTVPAVKTAVLDSVDYYIASSLSSARDSNGLSASLSAKGFTGLPAKTTSKQAHFAPTSTRYMVEPEAHAASRCVRSLVREEKESFPNYNGNYARIAHDQNASTMYTSSTRLKGMDYSTDTPSDDPRRGLYDTLRDTQNARYGVYKRAYGRF